MWELISGKLISKLSPMRALHKCWFSKHSRWSQGSAAYNSAAYWRFGDCLL